MPQHARQGLSFRAVNHRDAPGYDAGLQRHHLLPRQLLSRRCFGPLFESLGRENVGFDDFRSNGLLLPASDPAAVRLGLPLHRGPHRCYNALVIERVGHIETSWSSDRLRAPETALAEALFRLGLLQKALRRRLLDQRRKRFSLNRSDPFGRPVDYSELDALADLLWPETDVAQLNAGFADTA
jgi:A nuclease family of the HNH/ENDO VII superfamily with conserved AHH